MHNMQRGVQADNRLYFTPKQLIRILNHLHPAEHGHFEEAKQRQPGTSQQPRYERKEQNSYKEL